MLRIIPRVDRGRFRIERAGFNFPKNYQATRGTVGKGFPRVLYFIVFYYVPKVEAEAGEASITLRT